MKKAIVIAALIASVVCSFLISSSALADGKMLVYPYRWKYRPQPPKKPVVEVAPPVHVRNFWQNEKYPQYYRFGNENDPVQILVYNNPDTPPKLPKKCPWADKTILSQDQNPDDPNQQPDYNPPANPDPNYVETPPMPKPSEISLPSVNSNWNHNWNRDYDIYDVLVENDRVSAIGTFEEASQRAVIAWNGKEDENGEETLILTTHENSRVWEDVPMLSVMPLPGKVIDVKPVDPEIYNFARKALYSKYGSPEVEYMCCIFETNIGPHHIFVLELENLAEFKKNVNAYIAYKYQFSAAALIDPRTEKIIEEYFKRGYRYFAFDLTEVRCESCDKVAIMYRFKSTRAYFPLQISGVGGTSTKTFVTLIIFTPGNIQLTGAVAIGEGGKDALITGKHSVKFTKAEVAGIHEDLAKTLKDYDNVRGCEIIFEGTLNGYNNDFTARIAK